MGGNTTVLRLVLVDGGGSGGDGCREPQAESRMLIAIKTAALEIELLFTIDPP